MGTTVWGRVPEQIRKLSLLYAVSASHESPQIDVAAVRWATDFILHQTRRMLFMAHNHVAENPFHAGCLKLLRKLREAPEPATRPQRTAEADEDRREDVSGTDRHARAAGRRNVSDAVDRWPVATRLPVGGCRTGG